MLGDSTSLDHDTTPPNTRYEVKNLGTLSSVSDVDDFLYSCCHDTGYYGATIGSYVTINDGVYNKEWVIAGFDCEHNATAADGSTYDNGYGICLIPKKSLGNAKYGDSTVKGYNGSTINTYTLHNVAIYLKIILGDHLVLRNVLLSSARDSDYYASAYTWTTEYCTLMSAGQITGTFASNSNKYDDGEANYKLPLFNYETWSFDEWAWLRGLHGDVDYGIAGGYDYGNVYGLTTSGGSDWNICNVSHGLRPLIYIR